MKKTTVAGLKKHLKTEAKRLNSDFNDVPDWVIASAVKFFNDRIPKPDPEQKTLEILNNSISNDEHGDDKHILEFLRNADEEVLNENAHGYEFEAYPGCNIEISMWQPIEHWTLRMLKDHIGL